MSRRERHRSVRTPVTMTCDDMDIDQEEREIIRRLQKSGELPEN